jgi:hypothetical protein
MELVQGLAQARWGCGGFSARGGSGAWGLLQGAMGCVQGGGGILLTSRHATRLSPRGAFMWPPRPAHVAASPMWPPPT